VKNITDSQYFHPGLEQADSGDNFSQRSLGYRNSLLPQKGRTYFITLNFYL
jgi:iron complex outermembrane receptor protein